jgi:NAD(P)-dependent dehydrogenase (short-subunit alcohol dehydrogenase family)
MSKDGNKVAAVTGGASGIGEATARRLARDGYAIAVVDINAAQAEAVAAELRGPVDAGSYACDVSDSDALHDVAGQIEADLGPVEVLVTSAGLLENCSTVMDMDAPAHDRLWQVNYHGTLHTCRAFARPMMKRGRGAICTIGSIMSTAPSPLPAYTPSKTAILRLTQILAVELGRHGIRVNSVGPTYVLTPAIQARIDAGERDPEVFKDSSALKILVKPADVADVIAFLCSEQARVITGIHMPVDAGWAAATPYQAYAGGMPWDRTTTHSS